MIKVNNLERRFGSLIAVKNISFDVKQGEVFGFLGPNGAGKSTTIKMLCTILKQNQGTVKINGYDNLKDSSMVRKSIGIIFQDPSLDNNLTIYENLYFHAKLYHVPGKLIKEKIINSLKLVDLIDRKKDLVMKLSGGMKRRVEVARGILHSPKIFFLDEPTIGLDPQTRMHIWEYILNLRKESGMTIFLTTHYMDEAEICDRIAIIDHGEIIALASPSGLKKMVQGDIIFIKVKNKQKVKRFIETRFKLKCSIIDDSLHIVAKDSKKFIPILFKNLGSEITELDIKKTSLDDVFIKLTGRKIREEDSSFKDRLRTMAKMRRRI